jgi:hypothetical protein
VWEFEFQADTGPRHVKSVNWRAQGTDFIVYGSAAASEWPDLVPIFDAALAGAKP